ARSGHSSGWSGALVEFPERRRAQTMVELLCGDVDRGIADGRRERKCFSTLFWRAASTARTRVDANRIYSGSRSTCGKWRILAPGSSLGAAAAAGTICHGAANGSVQGADETIRQHQSDREYAAGYRNIWKQDLYMLDSRGRCGGHQRGTGRGDWLGVRYGHCRRERLWRRNGGDGLELRGEWWNRSEQRARGGGRRRDQRGQSVSL